MEKRENRKNREARERHQTDSEALLNDVGEMAHVGGWELDVRTKAVHWTKETYRIHDISEDEKFDLSKAILFFDLPDRSILEGALQRCMETGEPFDLELPFTSAKGRHLWTRAIGRAVKDGGKVVKLTGAFQDITERTRLEMVLKETNQFLQNLFDYANAPIITWDPGFHITRFNHAFERLTGRSQEEVLGKTLDLLFPDESRKASMALIQKTLRGERWETVEIPILNTDGSTKTVLWNSANVLDSEGKLTATIAQGVDITERKRADAALKVSEHKYRTLVENIPEKIFVKDALLAYVSCNDAYARDLGIAAGAIAGKTDFDFYPRDLAEKYRADDRAVMESGATSTIDERYVLNGVEFWVSTVKTPIRDNAGNISGILGIFHDITEQKRAGEAIRESEVRFRSLFERAAEGILVADIETKKFLHANPAICTMLGYSEQEITTMGIEDIHPKDDLDYVIGEFMAQARGEKILAENIPVLRKDKTVFYADITTTVIFIDGRMCNVGFFTDTTERKNVQDKLKKFNEELEQQVKSRTEELDVSLKEKEGLLKEIHHRVRNNLQVVGSIISLQAKSVSDPGSLKQIQEIRMRIGTLALVHEIAYIAKTPESLNMRDFLHRCSSRVMDEFGCEPGRINVTITAENVQVALNQAVPCSLIVNELLMNSLRHAFPGKRHGKIRIGFSIVNGNYVLEYSDDGVGFPEGMHPEKAETGGLSMIHGLASQIRGTVESKTRPGTGYTLTFPAEIQKE